MVSEKMSTRSFAVITCQLYPAPYGPGYERVSSLNAAEPQIQVFTAGPGDRGAAVAAARRGGVLRAPNRHRGYLPADLRDRRAEAAERSRGACERHRRDDRGTPCARARRP